MPSYSNVSDLLTGDVQIGTLMDPQKFVDDACDEMNSRIGMLYVLPLPTAPTLAAHIVILLHLINNRIASGRLIMAAATAAQSRELHAYGKSLVDDGMADLLSILNGSIALDGAIRRADANQALGPSIRHGDPHSAVDAFEARFYPDPWDLNCPISYDPIWRPGV